MPAREKLSKHFQRIRNLKIADAFREDPQRAQKFSRRFAGLYVDFSRHRLNEETLELLVDLARETDLAQHINDLFSGKAVNVTENRPALHTALRHSGPAEALAATLCEVDRELERMGDFIQRLHAGDIRGSSGKPIDTLIHVGIGGSDLGPRLACSALQHDITGKLNTSFVANVDPQEIAAVLHTARPETSLVIICSKSFTTAETLANAGTAKQWFLDNNCRNISAHFVAVTARPEEARAFGVDKDLVFPFSDWVGGRYSIWSSAGLTLAANIGMERFREFLHGARRMDEHFSSMALEENIPLLLGLIDCWYLDYFNCQSLAFIPYDASLALLPDYLSQLIMESNGKSVDRQGNSLETGTSPVVWGGVGSNAQHAFMQMLHQGTQLVPAEFLVPSRSRTDNQSQHNLLFANCLAQAETLARGTQDESLPAWRRLPGNRPSTIIVYEQMTPEILGMLLAMYEHRTFVQACVWGINPFDQWGVEQGKQAAVEILDVLEERKTDANLHPATRTLIELHRKTRQ